MKKAIVGLAVALPLALVAAGCPGRSGKQGEPGGAGPKKVKVGVVLEMTGNVATYGEETWNGLRLALEDLKGKGGWELELVLRDNKSESTETQKSVTELIEVHKVSAIIGAVASTNTIAGAKVAQESEVPMMTPGSTNVTVTQRGEYVSRICFIDPFQGAVMARFAYNDLGKKSAVIITDKASDYAVGLADAFRKTFEALGGKVLSEETYTQKEADFSGLISKVKEKGPECIFIPGYYGEVGPMLKQAATAWHGIPKLGGDGWDSPRVFELAAAGLQDAYMCGHFSPEDQDPVVANFVKRYKEQFGQVPGSMSALGYDAGLAIHDAVCRADSDDPRKVKDAINTIKGLRGVTGVITLNKDRDVEKDAVILEVTPTGFKFRGKVRPTS